MTSSNGNIPWLLAFVRGIHRSLVNSPYGGQWRGALMLFLIYVSTNRWANNGDATAMNNLLIFSTPYCLTLFTCGLWPQNIFVNEGQWMYRKWDGAYRIMQSNKSINIQWDEYWKCVPIYTWLCCYKNLCCCHTEAYMKWPPICRRHFKDISCNFLYCEQLFVLTTVLTKFQKT